jgi:hypothetical protein
MNSGPRSNQNPTTNAAQLRGKINSGETGDKVPFPDPAAAPLGTDDEAGGAPMRPDDIAAAAARETSRNTPTTAPDKTGPWVWAIIGAIVLVIIAAIAAMYWPAR